MVKTIQFAFAMALIMHTSVRATEKPNVIVIMADDIGFVSGESGDAARRRFQPILDRILKDVSGRLIDRSPAPNSRPRNTKQKSTK